jgi:uridylate kinase
MEVGAEVLIKATKVDAVYSEDPLVNPEAKRFARLSYIEALNMRVGVLDSTAISLCMENDLPIIVIDLWQPNSIERAVLGEPIGTIITT